MKKSKQKSIDKEFIDKLTHIVLDNFHNEQFGVSELAEKIGLSRSHLHRKLNLIKKQSISQFIREIRLQEALVLLKTEKFTASEVAYRVGFNNPSYFNKCFHEFFGFSPGETKHQNLEEIKEKQVFKEQSKAILVNKKLATLVFLVTILLIIGLIVSNVFTKNKLEEVRGAEGDISIAIMPFENLTGDTVLNFWQKGISEFLINSLANSDELIVLSSQAVHEVIETKGDLETLMLSTALTNEVANKLKTNIYISGNYIGTKDNLSILVNLIKSENGEILWSNRIDGDLMNRDYRLICDSLSKLIRNFLEIKSLEKQVNNDLLNAFPISANAYQHYINGLNSILNLDYNSAFLQLQKAIEIDSSFTFAYMYMAFAANYYDPNSTTAKNWTIKAFNTKKQLPQVYHNWINLWHACFVLQKGEEIRKYCDLLQQTQINSRFMLFDLAITYKDWLGDSFQAKIALQKIDSLNKAWDDEWKFAPFFKEYCSTLLRLGEHKRVPEFVDKGMTLNPRNNIWYIYKGAFYKLENDSVGMKNMITELKSNAEKYFIDEAIVENAIGKMYFMGNDYVNAEKHARNAYELAPEKLVDRFKSLNFLLIILKKQPQKHYEALILMKELKLLNYSYPLYQWSKGELLCEMGEYEEGLQLLRAAEDSLGYNYELSSFILKYEMEFAKE